MVVDAVLPGPVGYRVLELFPVRGFSVVLVIARGALASLVMKPIMQTYGSRMSVVPEQFGKRIG